MNRRRSNKAIATVPKTPLPSPFPSAAAKEPSFASVAKQGFSWGIGNALAHTVINRMIGPGPAESTITSTSSQNSGQNSSQNSNQNSSRKQVAYTQCMKDFADAEGCKHLLD